MIADNNNKQKGARRGAPNCQASGEGSSVPSLKPSLINITLTKKNSPRVVRIFSDPKDPHFATAEVHNQRTKATEWHYILSSDVPQWQGRYEREGFVVSTQKQTTQ